MNTPQTPYPAGALPGAQWTQTPPTEQGEYWHWNGDPDCAPLPMFVLFSGFTGKCFVSRGQLGLENAIDCDQYGGWWMPLYAPALPDQPEAPTCIPSVPPAPSANDARGAEQLLIELIATKQVLEEFKQVRVKEMCALLNMEMSATNTRLRDGIKLIHEWAAGASGFGMPSDPNERLDEIDKLCARLKVIAGITTESPRDQITRESFENEGKEHGEPQS